MLLRLTFALLLAVAAQAESWERKSSAFQAVRWKGETPIVRYEGTWYELLSLHGTSVKKLVEFCHSQYRDRWQKRFVEDLGQVLEEMGTRPAKQHQKNSWNAGRRLYNPHLGCRQFKNANQDPTQ